MTRRSRSKNPSTRRFRGRRGWVAAAVAASMLGAAAGSRAQAPAEASFAEALQEQVSRILEKSRPCVVRVEATDQHGKISGTGFFVDPNGLLYTTYTLGGDTHDMVVVMGDQKLPARRLAADDRCGIALLKVEAKTEFLPLGCGYSLAVGAPIMTIGFPMELPLTPSFGVVGGFDRKYLGQYFATTHLRANLAVQRGEGGAPLLNMRGEVVGILISSLDGGSASFVLPVEAAEKIRRDYVRFGEARPAWLGMSLEQASAHGGNSEARVADVFPEAPAQKAGVRAADVILEVAGKKVTAPEDMLDACFFLSAEDQVELVLQRAGERLELKVDAADIPGHPRQVVKATEERLRIGQ